MAKSHLETRRSIAKGGEGQIEKRPLQIGNYKKAVPIRVFHVAQSPEPRMDIDPAPLPPGGDGDEIRGIRISVRSVILVV